MHQFAYHDGQLRCEAVPLRKPAEEVGTPLYLYSYGTLVDHYRKLRDAFAPVKPLICFAMKANSSLAICRALAKEGAGFDVVSGGELKKALSIGVKASRIVYASVGKTEEEIVAALQAGILCFNVESEQELERIDKICQRMKKRQWVSLRLNPNVDPHTHAFISTGKGENKFGMDRPTVESIFRRKNRFRFVTLGGIHIHIGSQILHPEPFQQAIRRALSLIAHARARHSLAIGTLNIGGGLGIVYHQENPQTPAAFAKKVLPLLKGKNLKIILEPGRFIAGNGGVLLTRVLYLKKSRWRTFAIVDAAMNDLIRPSLYGAHHDILPVAQWNGPLKELTRYDVVGPICESGDFLAKDRLLPPLKPGDLLAIMGAGAYGFSMASNYNSRPRAAEVLCQGKRWYLIRRRETFKDLIRGERLPAFLR